jgi:16S rRNA (cytosine1407-C5)-methyltransferase
LAYNNTEVSEKIIKYLENLFGIKSAQIYLNYIDKEPLQYIRINPLKTKTEDLQKTLFDNYNIETSPIPQLTNVLKVPSGGTLLGKTIEHIIGKYYIQSLSSMIPPIVLSPKSTDKVLDLCAAPGSKTTHLAEIMNNQGTLIANEIQTDRLKSLVYNLDRMNTMNTGVIHTHGEWLSRNYQNYFDKILVDAPCSGLGIIQKKREISNWWSKNKAENLSELQHKLMVSAIKMLKPGGELVYSTCTLTVEENEMVIDKLLKKYPVEILPIELQIQSRNAFTKTGELHFNQNLDLARRIMPWEVESEGFFIVKIKKTDFTQGTEESPLSKSPLHFSSDSKLKDYLKQLSETFGIDEKIYSNYKYLVKANDIYFINKNWDDSNLDLFNRIGTKFGNFEKRGSINLHTQAAEVLQNEIKKNIIILDDKNEIKKYFEGGIIKRETGLKGQVVIKYKDSILGTAVVSETGIKSRFPRSKRTQEIYLE